MAKEQLAVIEMVTNMILGKTEGISKVDFVPQKTRCPEPENGMHMHDKVPVIQDQDIEKTKKSTTDISKKDSGKPGDSLRSSEIPDTGTGRFTEYRYASFYGAASWKCDL